jgi:hypothetical protein
VPTWSSEALLIRLSVAGVGISDTIAPRFGTGAHGKRAAPLLREKLDGHAIASRDASEPSKQRHKMRSRSEAQRLNPNRRPMQANGRTTRFRPQSGSGRYSANVSKSSVRYVFFALSIEPHQYRPECVRDKESDRINTGRSPEQSH